MFPIPKSALTPNTYAYESSPLVKPPSLPSRRFSSMAWASTNATAASATTAAAGTAQMSERSLKALVASLVATSSANPGPLRR